MTSTAKRIAKFEKVSFEQFKGGYTDAIGEASDEQIREVYDSLKLPKRATKGSAGYDFYAPFKFILKPGQTIKIPTGIRCEMNSDYVLMAFPRSGLGSKYQANLANGTGIIDSDYAYSNNEGHIMIKLVNRGDKPFSVKEGEGFAQGIFLPYGITVDDDCDGVRNGGFGSTTD